MTKKKTTAPEYVTREILKEEINRLDTKIDGVEKRLDTKIDGVENRLDAKIDGVEKRLDAKIETSTQSLKDYTDSRIQQVNLNIKEVGDSVHSLQQIVEKQGAKTDRYFEGIVKMIEGLHGRESIVEDRLKDYGERITVLEGTENGEQEHSMKN